MPPLDDEIRKATARASASVKIEGVFERLTRRKRWTWIRQRAATGMLTVTVIAATVVSTSLLNRTFQSTSASGFVAFTRLLRGCHEHPNVSGTRDVFAVDVLTGEERRVSQTDTWPDGTLRFEESPDFSPDGRSYVWVDHYRDDLYVTDVVSGETLKVTSGMSADRPQFSPDGTAILFSSGGLGTRLTSDDFEGHDHFEYVEEESGEIYVVRLDGSAPVLLTKGRLPTWTSDGRIAFARSTHVVRWQRVDGNAWTSSSTALPTSFYLMNADGSNVEQVFEYDGAVRVNDAEWSPDGTRVAAEVVMHGQGDIYVLDLETRIPTQLTDSPETDASPTWSPDGSFIAFHTRRWGDFTGRSEIAIVPSAGGDVIRLTHDSCFQDDNPIWIADGTTVASLPVWTIPPLPELGPRGAADAEDILVRGSTDGVGDLFAVDPGTGDITNITADLADQLAPAWSPDHTKIAFSSDADEPGNLDIYVMNADGTDVRRLTSHPEGESRPTWSPDGSRLAFEGRGGIWVVNADGSDAHRVTNAASGGHYPAWSPDGELIAFADADITVVTPDGSDPRTLVETNGDKRGMYYELEWSPDGSQLLFTCGRDVCVVNADGTDLRNLTSGPRDTYEREADWAPDGSEIVFTSDRADGFDMELYIMDADGTNVRPLVSDPRLDSSPDPDW